MKPTVSILTPTYNRREFLPGLIDMIRSQTYNLKKCEWIVLDDSPESSADLFEALARENTVSVQYYHYQGERLALGAKRNMLIDLAKGEYMVWADDDDFHMPCRISHSVTMLDKFKHDVGANSRMYLYFPDDEAIWEYRGEHGPGHYTNGTLVCRRSYIEKDLRRYDASATEAEESTLSRNYDKPVVQFDAMKTILVRCHSTNTVDKRFTRLFNDQMKATGLKLRDFIKDPKQRERFRNTTAYKPGQPITIPKRTAERLLASNQLSVRPSACSDESSPPERQCEGSNGPQ
jgi:glycosyltransferase involved in cell wall biosynthesis